MKDALATARKCHEISKDLPYPEGFAASSWWQNIQLRMAGAIADFKSAEEAILYAQVQDNTFFDHRDTANPGIIDFKIQELERLFPGLHMGGLPQLCESPFSTPDSFVDVDGIHYSNIFLTDVNYYLRSTRLLGGDGPKRVLEIGGGYGLIAYIFKKMNPGLHYAIVDLPGSLFFSQLFLMMNFPEAKIYYAKDDSPVNFDAYDFIFIPAQRYKAAAGVSVDIAINTGSLQEMPDPTVRFWMNFLQNILQPRLFYSFNYFLNEKKVFRETGNLEANLICPVLDQWWLSRYFCINPEVITVDCAARNWLELCVERIPQGQRDPDLMKRFAAQLFMRAKNQLRASNTWFQFLWMAIWYDPKPEYIREMLEGITLFRTGLRAKNYMAAPQLFDPTKVDELLRFANLINAYRQQGARALDQYSEIEYYINLFEKVTGKIVPV
jgi:hypothetical protein